MNPLDWIDGKLATLKQQGLLRELPSPLGLVGPRSTIDGRDLLNFASNDYLGLAGDERLRRAAADVCLRDGVGRGASPLICGRSSLHHALERRIAQFEQCEAALLFASGYAANTGVIPALVGPGDVVFSDAKNHASIVDGCRLSRAQVKIYPHADCEALERLVTATDDSCRRLIVTDSLFSMDGDLAPLPELARLASRHGAMLMLDEAHATGVFGAGGRGLVEHSQQQVDNCQIESNVHIRIGTLSKALGAGGGFVCGSASLIDWLANRARSYVFSTAQPSAVSAAAMKALEIVEQEPQRRRQLLQTAQCVREQLREQGWIVGASGSQIIPIMMGDPERAIRMADCLRRLGVWVPAIRPPSVPPGESLLRLSLTAAHTSDMIGQLLEAFAEAAVM